MKHQKELSKLAFILPSGIGTVIFYLIPLCYCFVYAFSGTSGRFTYAGFKNYISLFQSGAFRLALGNTYFLMAICIGTLILLSLGLVYFLDTSKRTLGAMLIFSLPMLLPATLITRCVEDFAIAPRAALLLIFLWKYTGFHVLLLKAMEMTMSPEWTEAAMLDHATKWQVFTKIRCWYLWPYIRFLIIFDIICFFRLFRESYLLYGKYPADEVYLITNFFFNNFQSLNYQRLSAAAIAALIPILILDGFLLKAGGKHEMV